MSQIQDLSNNGGATSVNSISGTDPIQANGVSGSPESGNVTISILDASTSQKGAASFNATNFSVVSGAVDTIQDINITAVPRFAGLTLDGSTSGDITLLAPSITAIYNFNLPEDAGTSGYFLTSQGGGSSAMTWTNPSMSLVTSISGTTNQIVASSSTGSVTLSISPTLVLPGTLQLGGNLNGDGYDITDIINFVFGDDFGNLQTHTHDNDSFNLQAYDVDGATYTSFITLTAGNTPSCSITGNSTWTGNVIGVTYGGTGASTLTNHGVLLGQGTSAIVATAVGNTGQVLAGNTGADPTWQNLSSLGVTSITGTANQIAASASTGAVTLSLTNGISLGSYQATSPPTGGIICPGAIGVGTNTLSAPTSSLLQLGEATRASSNYLWIDASNTVDKGIAYNSSGVTRCYTIVPGGAQTTWQLTTGTQIIGADLINFRVMIGTGTSLSTLGVNGGIAVGTYATTNGASSGNVLVSGQVGIATTSFNGTNPLLQLGTFNTSSHVYVALDGGASQAKQILYYNGGGGTFSVGLAASSTSYTITDFGSGTERLTIDSTGRTAIATSPNSSAILTTNSTLSYNHITVGTQTSIDGSSFQSAHYISSTMQPTNGSTLSTGVLSLPSIVAPMGQTILIGAGAFFSPIIDSNIGTITNLVGVYIGQQSTTAAGTISSAYNLYINQPLPSSSGNYYALNCQGGEIHRRRASAGDTTLTTADYLVGITNTSIARTVTLPATAPDSGWQCIIKDESNAAAANNITISRNGRNINGTAADLTINTNSGVFRIYSDGSNYWTW